MVVTAKGETDVVPEKGTNPYKGTPQGLRIVMEQLLGAVQRSGTGRDVLPGMGIVQPVAKPGKVQGNEIPSMVTWEPYL